MDQRCLYIYVKVSCEQIVQGDVIVDKLRCSVDGLVWRKCGERCVSTNRLLGIRREKGRIGRYERRQEGMRGNRKV